MKKKKYTDELKEQVVKECREIGNTALVSRRHGMAKGAVYTWVKKAKENGSVKSLPKDSKKKIKEVKKRLNKLSTENDQLKKILAEKELRLAFLRDLRDESNPL